LAFFDFPLGALEKYTPAEKAPKDFDAFWKQTLAETAAVGGAAPHFVQVQHPAYDLVDVYDVTFAGYMGQLVKGWYIEPKNWDVEARGKLPCIVRYEGYGGGRGLPIDHVSWAVAGLAVFMMDTRGQGAGWTVGGTPDDAPEGSAGPQIPGWMTRGIGSPATYYYRRVFVDAVRAIEAAASHPNVDAKRIGLTGISQGGGITIAAAALSTLTRGPKVKIAMPDVPYLCHYARACTIVDTEPYAEIARYCKTHRGASGKVFEVLKYFDGIHFAPKIAAKCLFSVGLMDNVCPPSTVFAAYNRVKGKKQIKVYDFNNHEGGASFQALERLAFAKAHL
jgi:cephalosporin-C deacetylase